jgi:arylsulfatase A-like enzyme
VVVVDWDGFDPSYLHRTRLPSLEALRRRGVRAHAWATYRPASNPSRASLVTGAYPQTHRNSAYVYDPAANVITGQTRRLAVDNLARSITRQGGTVAAAGWYMVENNGAYLGNPGALYVGAHGCEGNTDNAVRILRGEPVQSAGKQITVPRVPDLLAVYCPELDTVGHRVGPRSARITEVLRRLDAQLGRIVYATRQVGIHDDTTFVLVSDHGMTEFSQTAHDVLLHRLTAEGFRAEILVRGESPRPETEVIVAENERAAGVHLRGRAATPAARKRLRHLFAEISQIARVRDQRALRALHTAPSEGDFVLEARRPWCFVAPRKMPPPGTEKGAHGTLEEMTVPLVFAGRGIRAGSSPVQPRTIDVAPTLSALLGLQPPAHAQGRVLREILTSQATPVASMAGPAP